MISNKFHYKVSKVDLKNWDQVLDHFPDASIYQTGAFSKYSVGGEDLEQFLMYMNSKIVAAAIIRIKKIPVINRGTAYMRWAPLCLNDDPDIMESCLKHLHHEYVEKRHLLLRIMSNKFQNDQNKLNLLKNLGFERYSQGTETIIIDLRKDENELRTNLRKKWRYTLRQAEKKDLSVEWGTSSDFFDIFLNLYKEMHSRKKFDEHVDIESFKKINEALPENKKLRIFISKLNNDPVSAVVLSAIGKTGIYLLGGSSKDGLKVGASYYLQWQVIKWLRERDFHYYDLGGIDKTVNPGVFTFKSGMGGKEVKFIGGFQACESILSKIIVKVGELIISR